MGHIKDTVPEQPNNMTLKEFMVNHITNYWPGVFRGLAKEQWPAFSKWQKGEAYFKGKAGFDSVKVSTIKNTLVILPFNQQEYETPADMLYSKFLSKSAKLNEDNFYPILDNVEPPSGLMPDIVEPNVTA